ncbi:MAG: YdeI/OmpD-associated family protein [Myxococcaceae bacterium]|nr:YdeI/OmpD-associated family protein [Myxococcaceae bacterium]
MAFFEHRFTTTVTTHTFHPKSGKGRSLTYRVVFLSSSLERTLTFSRGSRLRFLGEVNGAPVQGAWQSAPGKGHYCMLSADTLAQADADVGTEVEVAFTVVDDAHVVVPDDLEAALRTSARAQKRWEALTPSARRAHVADVERAKTTQTRRRRIEAVLSGLR